LAAAGVGAACSSSPQLHPEPHRRPAPRSGRLLGDTL